MSCCKEDILKTKKGYKYFSLIFGRKPTTVELKKAGLYNKNEDKKIETRPVPKETDNIEIRKDNDQK